MELELGELLDLGQVAEKGARRMTGIRLDIKGNSRLNAAGAAWILSRS